MEQLTEEIRELREAVKNLQLKEELPQFMTTAQCAQYLQRSEEVLLKWRRERTGPPYLHITTRTLLYDRDDVVAWARSHKVQ